MTLFESCLTNSKDTPDSHFVITLYFTVLIRSVSGHPSVVIGGVCPTSVDHHTGARGHGSSVKADPNGGTRYAVRDPVSQSKCFKNAG